MVAENEKSVTNEPIEDCAALAEGPLYRHRGGVFRKSLRYSPLTLPTLASLVPPEIDATVEFHDEGVGHPRQPRRGSDRHDRHHRYCAQGLRHCRANFGTPAFPSVLGGPHVTLVPEDSAPHADAIVVGHAEETWPQLLRDFSAGRMRQRYDQAPDFRLGGYPVVDRTLLQRHRYATSQVRGDTRLHSWLRILCSSISLGPETLSQADRGSGCGNPLDGREQAIFVDLDLIADIDYARELFSG